jgi:hypothetical protein
MTCRRFPACPGAWAVSEATGAPWLEDGPFAQAEFPGIAGYPGADHVVRAVGLNFYRQLAVGDCNQDRGLPELHRERQAVQAARQPRVEVQHVVADVAARVVPLHDVEGGGHDTQVDSLFRCSALDVVDIAAERDKEAVPRAFGVDGGEHSGMGDDAQRGAVRRPLVVVLDVPHGRIRPVVVPEPVEYLPQFRIREQVEKHHRVGLLGDLVPVGVDALGTQDPVEPLDVPVLGAVGVPVQFFEVRVTLELADDAVTVERDEHPAAHVLPQR